MMAVITHIRGLKKKWNPADLILGKENSQGGEAIEQSREHPLHGCHGAVAAHRSETAHLIDEIVGQFFHDFSGS